MRVFGVLARTERNQSEFVLKSVALEALSNYVQRNKRNSEHLIQVAFECERALASALTSKCRTKIYLAASLENTPIAE